MKPICFLVILNLRVISLNKKAGRVFVILKTISLAERPRACFQKINTFQLSVT